MARKEIYSVKLKGTDGFQVFKGDFDFNPTGQYNVSASGRECDCFAGNKHTCRHRQMVADYITNTMNGGIDGKGARELFEAGYWYEFDRGRWIKGVEV